ncbi:MAG: response regulator [bacterium]|nr:response regulator [bacterium]
MLKVLDHLKLLLDEAGSGSPSTVPIKVLILELQRLNKSAGAPPPTVLSTSQSSGAASTDPAKQETPPTELPGNITAQPEPDEELDIAPIKIEKKHKKESYAILVVEDDFTSRKVLKHLLQKYGHVDIAVNGEEALEAFKLTLENDEVEDYDLICMDIMMPELDGMTATREIRYIEKKHGTLLKNEVPIIMTTALDDPKTVIKSLYKCGASAYMVKPIKKPAIEKELKKLGMI